MPAFAADPPPPPLCHFDDDAWPLPDEEEAPDEDWPGGDFDPDAPAADDPDFGFDEDGFDDDLEPELPDWARRRNQDEEE